MVGTIGCDAILHFYNTFSAEYIRGNADKKCHPCPDETSSKQLVSDRCKYNADADNSECASVPKFITDTPSQSNKTK